MKESLATPKFPFFLILVAYLITLAELVIYGVLLAVPLLWVPLLFGAFYLGFVAFFRKDALPVIFSLLFFTTHHSLVFHFNHNFPIAPVFVLIFIVYSAIMWLLLRYGTHLKPEYHTAYSLISGFMIAQIITLFATMTREWPIRFEVASYIPTAFSYTFWRFACLSADAVLGWKQFLRVALLILILTLVIILGSPNVQV